MAACRLAGCGFVWHAHDGSFQGFVGRQRPLLRRLLGAALRQAHVVIVLSDETRRALEPLVPGVGWLVIPNGVPVPRLTPKPSGPDTRFIFLGNLSQRKGAFDLVEAVVRIADRVPVCLDLAGDEKEPGQRAALERHIARCGCGDRVRLLGVITARAKEQAMAEAHAMVLPSYAEGLPMALLEAMAYGMPTIATRVGAVPEAVTDGVEGFLIEPGDVEALADRMLRLAANPDLRRRMGEAARRRAEAEFGIDLMVERIMAVYQEVLGRGRAGR
jgi:glycosyltransferase involved in cell wall biosynthesis